MDAAAARPETTGTDIEPDAPITDLVSSRLMVLANLLRRGATARYRREFGLAPSEFGLIAALGRRPPVTLSGLAQLIGMDRGQISRNVTGLVERGLLSRDANPDNNREVLIGLTPAGLAVHDAMVRIAQERNAFLLAGASRQEVALLGRIVERLGRRAALLLDGEPGPATDGGRP